MVILNRPTTHRDPFVLNDIVNGESILWICFEHPPNEFFGVRRDVGPFGLGKLVLARANAFLHAGGYGEAMVAVEWGKSTQPTGRGGKQCLILASSTYAQQQSNLQNVHDNPEGPDIAGSVVLLGTEHLGR